LNHQPIASINDHGFDSAPDTFSTAKRLCQIRTRQENDEFLATEACDQIPVPAELTKYGGNFYQNQVAYIVTMGVIDRFEMIDINGNNRQRLTEKVTTIIRAARLLAGFRAVAISNSP